MTTDNPLPQQIGRYRVVRELGKGAMGRVLLAEDPVLQRKVALKHLRGDLSLSPEQKRALIERMGQEARASARVSHPHLVALFDMGEDPELGLYLVFEYVEGPTLHERLKQGPLPIKEAARLVRELGEALAYAHSRGIVHRDVKPENVILSRAGSKLADFGIARLPDSTLTQGTGVVLGTPAYSAPEALRGAKFSAFSDQFSLGATAYEAISGRRPFPGDDALAVAARITNDQPARIAHACGLQPTVDVVLNRVLAKTPQARFNNCADFGNALNDALLGTAAEIVRARQPTLPDQWHAEPPRRGFGWLLASLASAAATWAVMTLANPRAEATPVQALEQATEWDEEDPKAVAWLARSPDDDDPEPSDEENDPREREDDEPKLRADASEPSHNGSRAAATTAAPAAKVAP